MSRSADLDKSNVDVPIIDMGDEARSFVVARGGTLYLRVRQSHCCSGGLTFLDADTQAPSERGSYRSWDIDGLAIQLCDAGLGLPRHIAIEVRGRMRPHLVAYWDGCAYRL